MFICVPTKRWMLQFYFFPLPRHRVKRVWVCARSRTTQETTRYSNRRRGRTRTSLRLYCFTSQKPAYTKRIVFYHKRTITHTQHFIERIKCSWIFILLPLICFSPPRLRFFFFFYPLWTSSVNSTLYTARSILRIFASLCKKTNTQK